MTTKNTLVRILVVDDSELIRGSLCSVLRTREDFTVCGEATDGTEALHKATELRPDVILLDLSMPGINGIEAAVFIHEEVPQAEILIVTEHDSSTLSHLPKLPGVRGYVMKSQMERDLIAAIEAASNHQPVPTSPHPKPRVVAA